MCISSHKRKCLLVLRLAFFYRVRRTCVTNKTRCDTHNNAMCVCVTDERFLDDDDNTARNGFHQVSVCVADLVFCGCECRQLTRLLSRTDDMFFLSAFLILLFSIRLSN